MVKEKRKSKYWPLVLLTVLLGLGIQLALGYADYHREAARAMALLTELSQTAGAEARAESRRRSDQAEAAARRLAALPSEKRARYEGEDDSLLLLVNAWNPVPEGYDPALRLVAKVDGREYEVDVRCADALLQMMDDCRAAGCSPYICSAFRTRAKQQELFDNKVLRVMILEGCSLEEAPEIAAQSVAIPGTSEHELGLAVDIIDQFYPYLDEGQEQTETQAWLMENCWRYGFILRYPNGTTDITGIIYEPWHYRYVGQDYAREITQMGLTLEEYVRLRQGR